MDSVLLKIMRSWIECMRYAGRGGSAGGGGGLMLDGLKFRPRVRSQRVGGFG